MRGLPLPPDWLTPDWPAPAGVHALCTARSGGVSTGPYASCNLGDHVGDDAAAVRANRARLTDVLRSVTPGASPVFLKQVHGDGVLTLAPGLADGEEADACVTTAAGVLLFGVLFGMLLDTHGTAAVGLTAALGLAAALALWVLRPAPVAPPRQSPHT